MTIDNYDDAVNAFEDMLDEVCGPVIIAGHSYDAAYALKEVDPIAYREAFLNWLDSEGVDSDSLTGDYPY